MTTLLTIPLDQIDIVDGHNPRGQIDADGLQPLADSIAAHGVLQPIIVRPAGDRFELVAGERRFTAAGIAGETEIPAVVRDVSGDAFSVAIVENLQREQLSPIEEARAFQRACNTGMDPGALAGAINVSEQLVRDRLALLKLPESVQAKVDSRELTLAAAKSLQSFAGASDFVIEKIVELLGTPDSYYGEPITARDLERDPATVLESTLDYITDDQDVPDEKVPFLAQVKAHGYAFLDQHLEWGNSVDIAALQKKSKELPEYEHAPRYRRPRFEAQAFTDDDLDAARTYGCVLVLSSRDGRDDQVWITDPVWLADRLAQKLDVAIEAHAKKAVKAKTPATPDDAAKAEREKAAAARKREQTKMLASRDRNIRLGAALSKKLHAPTITVDGMRAIAELLVTYAGDDLGRCGLRFTDEASQTETRRKDGSLSKVTHTRTERDAAGLVEKLVAGAETAEEIYGALLQAIVAAAYADPNAAPTSDRYGAVRGLVGYATSKSAVAAVDAIAKTLPDDLRKKPTRRR